MYYNVGNKCHVRRVLCIEESLARRRPGPGETAYGHGVRNDFERGEPDMKRIVSIMLAVMLLIAVMPTAAFAASTKTVYVSRSDSNSRIYIRSGAGYDYPQKGVVYHKDQVSVLDTSGEWSKVKIVTTRGSYKGSTGWIRTYYIDGTTKKLCEGSKAIKSTTKVYASASTKASVRGTLYEGDAVKVYYFEQDFARVIANGSGLAGWIPMRDIGATAKTTPEKPSGDVAYRTTASVLNVRSGPGTSYKIVNKLVRNTPCTVLKSSGNWRSIKTFNGVTGWVSATYLARNATGKVATRGSRLNVRRRPSTSATILGSLNNGTRVTVTNVSGNWAYITYGSLKGWASLTYLKF